MGKTLLAVLQKQNCNSPVEVGSESLKASIRVRVFSHSAGISCTVISDTVSCISENLHQKQMGKFMAENHRMLAVWNRKLQPPAL